MSAEAEAGKRVGPSAANDGGGKLLCSKYLEMLYVRPEIWKAMSFRLGDDEEVMVSRYRG